MDTAPGEQMMTVDEVAVILRCSRNTALREIQRKNLRATKSASRWLITRADLDRYLKTGANVTASP